MYHDLASKVMNPKRTFVEISMELSDFECMANEVIKRDTGVDVSSVSGVYIGDDEETLSLYVSFDEGILTEEEQDKISKVYNIGEDYVNMDILLTNLFGASGKDRTYFDGYAQISEDKQRAVIYMSLKDYNITRRTLEHREAIECLMQK